MTVVIQRTIGPWQRLSWAAGIAALLGALCLGVASLWGPASQAPDQAQPSAQGRQNPADFVGPSWGPSVTTGPAMPDPVASGGPALPDPVEPFQADAQGALRISPATLRTLEQLLVTASGRPVAPVALAHARTLPAAAQAQAVDLAERYERYDASLRQLFPVAQEAPSMEALMADAQAMHALRRQWFGEGMALQLFGPEEETTTQLKQWMGAQ
jgi:hypothetical protein